MTDRTADATTLRQLREALECAERTECQFFACPGPGKPMKSMATCTACRMVQLLRRACARLGIETGKEGSDAQHQVRD